MTTPLLSTYRQGENRVTSTFLAVLQRLSLPNMDRILGALLQDDAHNQDDTYNLVTFKNQPPGDGSRPDGKIGTGHAIWIETKTARNAVRRKQIKEHLNVVCDDEKLLVLTPDDDKPEKLKAEEFRDRVVWSNFIVLSTEIENILTDAVDPPTEREAFLLREFNSLLEHEGLTFSPENRVMVVPASSGWQMYQRVGGYRRTPDIRWKASAHLAFYSGGQIKPVLPRIKSMIPTINITRQEAIVPEKLDDPQRKLAEELLERLDRIDSEPQPDDQQLPAKQEYDGSFMVFFLSECSSDETLKLKQPIENDLKYKNGRTKPFVRGHARYVTLESLLKARNTSKLEFC